jgi:hypothetical protein
VRAPHAPVAAYCRSFHGRLAFASCTSSSLADVGRRLGAFWALTEQRLDLPRLRRAAEARRRIGRHDGPGGYAAGRGTLTTVDRERKGVRLGQAIGAAAACWGASRWGAERDGWDAAVRDVREPGGLVACRPGWSFAPAIAATSTLGHGDAREFDEGALIVTRAIRASGRHAGLAHAEGKRGRGSREAEVAGAARPL